MSDTVKKATTKATKPASKKATKPTTKAAPVKRAMPAGTKVAPVRTLGGLIIAELQSRGITTAAKVEITRTTGERVTVNSYTAGVGVEPANNFRADSLKITQEGKAA